MDFNYYIYQHLQQVYSSLWTSSPSGASSRTCVRNTENRGRQLQRGSQNHWLGFGKFRKHTKSALHATTGRGPSSLSGPPGMFHIYTQPWLLLWHTLFLFLRRWNRPRRKCKWSGRSGERWATLMRACFKKLLFSRLYLVKQGMKSWDASLREQAGALLLCVCVNCRTARVHHIEASSVTVFGALKPAPFMLQSQDGIRLVDTCFHAA